MCWLSLWKTKLRCIRADCKSELAGEYIIKQITLLDSQVKLTTLQIDDTRRKIDILDNEIGELTQEIVRLEDLKTKRLELVLHRIPQTYKRANASNFGGLLFSKNFLSF